MAVTGVLLSSDLAATLIAQLYTDKDVTSDDSLKVGGVCKYTPSQVDGFNQIVKQLLSTDVTDELAERLAINHAVAGFRGEQFKYELMQFSKALKCLEELWDTIITDVSLEAHGIFLIFELSPTGAEETVPVEVQTIKNKLNLANINKAKLISLGYQDKPKDSLEFGQYESSVQLVTSLEELLDEVQNESTDPVDDEDDDEDEPSDSEYNFGYF